MQRSSRGQEQAVETAFALAVGVAGFVTLIVLTTLAARTVGAFAPWSISVPAAAMAGGLTTVVVLVRSRRRGL